MSTSIDPALLEIFACPQCHAPLRLDALDAVEDGEATEELACTNDTCALVYPIRDGIPVLLVDEARRPA